MNNPFSFDSQKRILVVDDDTSMTELFSHLLTKNGYRVTLSNRMETALNVTPGESFDMAFVDIFMPAMGGIEGIPLIAERFPSCWIIAMSSGWADMTPEKALEAAQKVGAHDILSKPFDLDEIPALIEKYLGSGEDK